MKRVLFVQRNLQPPGGGNALAAWMLQALASAHDVTVLTEKGIDEAAINSFYGTTLNPARYRVLRLPRLLCRLLQLDPDPNSFQAMAILLRWAKWIAGSYDVVISSNDEVDLGGRGLQYIHYPYLHAKLRTVERLARLAPHQTLWALLTGRYRPWMLVSGFSVDAMKKNVSLVNSDWTGGRVRQFYDIDSITVYPAVHGDFPNVPWEQRANGFLTLARFADEKMHERAVDILEGVRSHGLDAHLHIVGTPGLNGDYNRRIRQLALDHPTWVFVHENLSRDELTKLISSHRYGLHTMPDEHFGIAVAEMVRAGCIVYVPDSGGQVEIVGDDPRLRYRSTADAVAKIVQVMRDPAGQTELRARLDARSSLFTVEHFVQRILAIVDAFPLKAG